jgi:hypothetical protein
MDEIAVSKNKEQSYLLFWVSELLISSERKQNDKFALDTPS